MPERLNRSNLSRFPDALRIMKGALRSLARNRIIRKRLPSDLGGGTVFCSPDAMLSTWKPGWQSDQTLNLFNWARRFVSPGNIVWDVGANQGLFSFAAASAAGPSGHVIAFEPDPFLAGLMYRTRQAQSAGARVDVLPVAISSRDGLATFRVAAKDRALNHLDDLAGNPHTGGARERFAVVTATLEWMGGLLPPPDLIKIDVEGGELAALEHAGSHLLEHVRPRWIVEVANENASGVAGILSSADYRLFDANQPECELLWPAWNTLAIPAEKCESAGNR